MNMNLQLQNQTQFPFNYTEWPQKRVILQNIEPFGAFDSGTKNPGRISGQKSKHHIVKSRYIGDGHPTSNKKPYNGYILG